MADPRNPRREIGGEKQAANATLFRASDGRDGSALGGCGEHRVDDAE